MKILEKILVAAIAIALIMKFSLISGGDILALWTMVILGCLYYPLGFLFLNQIRLRHVFKKEAYQNVTTPGIILSVVLGISLSTIIIGSLFKLLSIMGADGMLRIGLIVTAILSIISLVISMTGNGTSNKFMLWRAGIIAGIGIVLLLTSELSIVKLQYRNHPQYIEAYTNYLADPRNEELYRKVELERNRIRLSEDESNGQKHTD
jgi:hypothetical protein